MNKTLLVDSRDTVAVALQTLAPATEVVNGLKTLETIPAKHKVALKTFNAGDTIHMYGVTVGSATELIPAGGLLTIENVEHRIDAFSAAERQPRNDWNAPDVTKWTNRTFLGYHRRNGQVGTANLWLVIPLVFCENRNVEAMREAVAETLGADRSSRYQRLFKRLALLRERGATPEEIMAEELPEEVAKAPRLFPNVDGVKFLIHGQGCGGTGQDAASLCGLLAGYATHPNVAGVTVLSLGCQKAELQILEKEIARRDPQFCKPFHVYTQQKSPSEQAMLTEALKRMFLGLDEIGKCEREPAPLSALTIGMECGGSDGFSGISANPCLGRVADNVVALGGKTILSEFPELCGVERELLNRCTTNESAERFEFLMRLYEGRAQEVGTGFHLNPSPGNLADGLITDAIKSAGAAKKGGTSPIVDVLDYPEWAKEPGLSLLCTPGGDVESTTAMAGAWANVMIFTTGLGTPTGNPVTPVIKVATNSEMAFALRDIIDFDAGPIIRGQTSIAELGDALFDMVIEVASGRQTCAMRLGQDDFLPWKRGISL